MVDDETNVKIKPIKPIISPFSTRKATCMLTGENGQKITFYAGLLLLYGPSISGKSTTALALVMEAGKQGSPAGHITWDEIGSTNATPLTPIDKVSMKPSLSVFTVPTAGLGVVPASSMINDYIAVLTTFLTNHQPRLLVIDSIGPALSLSSGLVDQPAGKGAMVEGYGSFLRMINQIGVLFNCTIVGVINESLFTVRSLEGACDGVIEMSARGSFYKRDRTNRVLMSPYVLSDANVREAIDAMGSQTSTGSDFGNPLR